MSSLDKFFDGLKLSLELLSNNPEFDNEASRHDKLIFPMLTNELALGWGINDIWAQKTILVPIELTNEYTFSGGIPKSKRPDLIIKPFESSVYATVIEEKSRQENIKKLGNYNNQLLDYLGLFKCTWGILTDGEKWIIKKGFEDYLICTNFYELQKSFKDFQYVLSRSNMIDRYNLTKSFDLIYFRNQPTIISAHANKLSKILLAEENISQAVAEEMASLFLAFLDTNYSYEYKLPGQIRGGFSHSISWSGNLNYIIEAVTLISKHGNCKLITLDRNTAEKNREYTIKNYPKIDHEKYQFTESISSVYIHDFQKPGSDRAFVNVEECYDGKIAISMMEGAEVLFQ